LPICRTHAGYPSIPGIAPSDKELLPILRHWMMMISAAQKLENQVAFLENHSDCILLGFQRLSMERKRELNNANYILKEKNVRKDKL